MESVEVVMSSSMGDIGKGKVKGWLAHVLCYQGSCKFIFHNNGFELKRGNSCIIRKTELFHLKEESPDLMVMIGGEKITSQYNQTMQGFIALLENGDFRREKEVGYYADKLFVTPKYLSEASKNVSGFAANHWITQYTVTALARELRNKSKTFTEISDEFGFSSHAYFTRYVQKYLGTTPTDFRE